jgi:hypothetical protein
MTAICCYVHKGLVEMPKVSELEDEYELDKVALLIAELKSFCPGPRFVYWKQIDGLEHES